MPSGEDEREEPSTETGDEEARDASSNESRGAARLPFLVSWENPLDILFVQSRDQNPLNEGLRAGFGWAGLVKRGQQDSPFPTRETQVEGKIEWCCVKKERDEGTRGRSPRGATEESSVDHPIGFPSCPNSPRS